MEEKKQEKNKAKKTKLEIFWITVKTLCKVALVTSMVAVCIVVGLFIGIFAGCIITTDTLEDEDLYITGFVSYLYDNEGNIIGTLKGSESKNREIAEYEEIPQDLIDAIISIEDERFYEHDGVDYKRTIGATLSYFIPGFPKYGGSTITQQLVKNITGDDARSVPRKIREQWRSLQLEKEHSKEEILELYCNVIFMANDVYGVKKAAETYFNKELSDLNLAECALLAGITNSPSKYNPMTTKGRSNAYTRQIVILDKMLALGYITEQEYMTAIQTDLVFNENYKQNSSNGSSSVYSYFMEAAVRDLRNDLMTTLGYTEEQANNLIYNSGISINTTMDPDIQAIVNEEFNDVANFPTNKDKYVGDTMAQAAITITDPYTGYVVALYGGYGEKTGNWAFNRATDAKRQPGSSIKPIILYGPLLDMGLISPDTMVEDKQVFLNPDKPDEPWPKNSGNVFYGNSTVRQAIYRSQNVAAALLYDTFEDKRSDCLNYLKLSGIDRTKETQISACLGGFTEGMSTREMVGAFSPFVTDGTYNPAITYTHVYDRNGDLIFTNPHTSVKLYSKESAEQMTSMLRDVVTKGTAAGYINVTNSIGEDMTACGKTGTTTNNYDRWFVGYTPYYAAAVWYGYDNNTYITQNEYYCAVNLWDEIMDRIHSNLSKKEYSHTTNSVASATIAPQSTAVAGKVEITLCSDSGQLAHKGCPNTSVQSFISGTEPKLKCEEHIEPTLAPTATPAGTKAPSATATPVPSVTPSVTDQPTTVPDVTLQPTPDVTTPEPPAPTPEVTPVTTPDVPVATTPPDVPVTVDEP